MDHSQYNAAKPGNVRRVGPLVGSHRQRDGKFHASAEFSQQSVLRTIKALLSPKEGKIAADLQQWAKSGWVQD